MANKQINQFSPSTVVDSDIFHTKESTGEDTRTTFGAIATEILNRVPAQVFFNEHPAKATANLDDYYPVEDYVSKDLMKVKLRDMIKLVGQQLLPVGSIYFNYSLDTNPSTLLGFGTWSKIEDRFLVSKGPTWFNGPLGTLGGSMTHSHGQSLSTSTAGSHNHGSTGLAGSHTHVVSNSGWGDYQEGTQLPEASPLQFRGRLVTHSGTSEPDENLSSLAVSDNNVTTGSVGSHSHSTGTSGEHSHSVTGSVLGTSTTPLHVVVSVWRRVA